MSTASAEGSPEQLRIRDDALARALFESGVGAAEGERWSDAAEYFRRAHALRPTLGIAYNLGTALSHGSALLEAQALLLRVARDPAAPAALAGGAERALAELASRVPQLRVSLEGPSTRDSQVLLDGAALRIEALGVSAPVDPGRHVVVRAEGSALGVPVELVIAESERAEVLLPVLPPPPQLATAPAPAPSAIRVVAPDAPEPRDSAPPPRRARWWWAAGGAVAAAAAGGLIWALVHRDPAGARPSAGNASPGTLTW